MSNPENESGGKKKDHLSPYPLSRLAPPFELVDLAAEIADAGDMIALQASGKLRLLADQIKGLQEEAKQILKVAKRNQELHQAECGFVKKAGQTYHLYRKNDGACLFSLLSPKDWQKKAPYTFVGSYRLEVNMSWTEITVGTD